jgi:hypothetical protein
MSVFVQTSPLHLSSYTKEEHHALDVSKISSLRKKARFIPGECRDKQELQNLSVSGDPKADADTRDWVQATKVDVPVKVASLDAWPA